MHICIYIYIFVYNSLEARGDLFTFKNCQWKSFFYTTLS